MLWPARRRDAVLMPRRLLALAALAVLSLTACAAPAPSSTPAAAPAAASATPSPTPTTPSTPVPAELVVRGAGVQLYDSAGSEIGAFAWADETATALAVLELAFGPAPAPSIRAGDGTHYADYEAYEFPGGFTYFTAIDLEKPRAEYFLPSSVQVDTGEPINGVSIRTFDGLQVGGTLAEVLALSPALNYEHPLGTVYLVDPVDAAVVADPENATDMVAAIIDGDGTLMRIIAPYPSRSFI